ncbi:MFS transporter [Rhodococcus sp. NPDC058514]|uniref:MFS transporter n=1 Tax=unclassified Rhodococcus (in: high G+C Gram-positive bacteria) TaxID=192944 RepID=UPI00365D4B6A
MELNSQLSRQVHPWPVLVALCGASFLANLDLFVVNVAFDEIRAEFAGHGLSDLSWVLNAYAILYAALLIPLGRWADRIGRRRGFLIGLGLFVAASAACAAAPDLWWLVGFRGAQAVGAALLTPASLALILTVLPAERRSASVQIWAAVGALASAAGPVLGGLLVAASWRWVFLINVPIGLAFLVLAARAIPESRDRHADHPDIPAAALLAAAIGALALGLVRAPDWGWTSAGTLACLGTAVAAAIAFRFRDARSDSPILEPAMLRVRSYAWSNAAMLLFSLAFAAGLLAVILWMQTVWGYSALRTGLAIAPGPLMVPVFAVVAQRLATRIDAGRIAAAGCLLWGAGAVLILTSVGAEPAYAGAILPGWLVAGVGVGLAMPTTLSAATASLPQDRAATGSAVVSMQRQIGAVLGVSALIAIVGSPVGFDSARDVFTQTWCMVAIVSVLAAGAALGITARPPVHPAPTTAPAEALR